MSSKYEYIVSQVSSVPSGRILVLAPHADDEVIGCGGTIIAHINKNNPVKIVILTDSSCGDYDGVFGKNYTMIHEEEAKEAASALGVRDLELWRYQDRKLKADTGTVNRLKELLEAYKPSAIYFPSFLEIHPDHTETCELVIKTLPLLKYNNFELYMYEVSMPLLPNIFINITPYLDAKIKALSCYKTQLYYSNYIDKAVNLSRIRSRCSKSVIEYAEAFLKIDKKFATDYKKLFDALKDSICDIKLENKWLFNNFPFLYCNKLWTLRQKIGKIRRKFHGIIHYYPDL